MQLQTTITPRGQRWFINSRRVTKEAYDLAQFWRRLDCFLTTIHGDTIRHYVNVRIPLS
jgi:hypothetical protein